MYNPDKRDHKGLPYCEFCGKTKNKVKVLVAGPSVYICDECISLCQAVVNKELHKIEKKGI